MTGNAATGTQRGAAPRPKGVVRGLLVLAVLLVLLGFTFAFGKQPEVGLLALVAVLAIILLP